jgi:hypothetical protein
MKIDEIEKRAAAATPEEYKTITVECSNFVPCDSEKGHGIKGSAGVSYAPYADPTIEHWHYRAALAEKKLERLESELRAQTERADDIMKLAEKMNICDLVAENLRLAKRLRFSEVETKVQAERAERAEKRAEAAIKDIQKVAEIAKLPCLMCRHDTGDYVCKPICGGCGADYRALTTKYPEGYQI